MTALIKRWHELEPEQCVKNRHSDTYRLSLRGGWVMVENNPTRYYSDPALVHAAVLEAVRTADARTRVLFARRLGDLMWAESEHDGRILAGALATTEQVLAAWVQALETRDA